MRLVGLLCALMLSCGGQEPTTITDALAGSWSVSIGTFWTAEWNNVTVQNGALVGTGTIVHDGIEKWNVAIGGHVVSDTHATIRMDLTPASQPSSLPTFNVFCEADLASMSFIEGYVTADVLLASGAMLNGSALQARKR